MSRSKRALLLIAAGLVCLPLAIPLGIPLGIPQASAGRLASEHTRDGRAVKQAFREVIADVRRSVVKVMRYGEQRGLGVIVSPEGYVLTKASTLATQPVCQLRGGRPHKARVVHRNDELDLALLKIDVEGRELPHVVWAEIDLRAGQWVIAPGTREDPLAVGVVGGPARKVKQQSGILGVSLNDTEDGPRITRVYPYSAASRAKLQKGDLVTHLDGKPVANRGRLTQRIKALAPGTEVELEVQRNEKQLTIKVSLGSSNPVPSGNHDTREFSVRRFGFTSAFEHDAMLTADECGGLLVNLRGEPIGITIARVSRTGCYALPAKLIAEYLRDRLGDVSPPESD